jgi:hypothetical protein
MAEKGSGDLIFKTSGATPHEAVAVVEALIASGALQATSQTQPPQQALSSQYQTLLNSIPIANDGNVILAEHHNSLRAAIGVLARNRDDSAFARLATIAHTPALLPVTTAPAWGHDIGAALTHQDANGWMPLDLPQGSRLESLTVRAERHDGSASGFVDEWHVAIARHEVAGADHVTLGTQDIAAKKDVFVAPVDIHVDRATQAEMEGYRRIDNTRYRYLFTSNVDGVQDTELRITGVDVVCSRW